MTLYCRILVSTFLLPVWAMASPADRLDVIYKIPAWIDQTKRVCPWKSKAGQGYLRFIRTEELGQHGVYLQWIRKGIAGTPAKAVSTLWVEELESDFQVHIAMPSVTLENRQCVLTSMAEDITTERRYQMIFIIKGPGEYQLQVTRLYDGSL